MVYYDNYSLEAVCKLAGKEVRYKLQEQAGSKWLGWEQGGRWQESTVPLSFKEALTSMKKRPASALAAKKKPAGVGGRKQAGHGEAEGQENEAERGNKRQKPLEKRGGA